MTESDSDSDFDLNDFQPSGLSQSSRSSLEKHAATAGKDAPAAKKQPPPDAMAEEALQRAQQKISYMIVPKEINHSSQLLWHIHTKKKKRLVFPCRSCHKDEAIGLALNKKWDENKQILVEYIGYQQKAGKSIVNKSQIKPYGVDGALDPGYLKEYLASVKTNKLLEELALKRLLEAALERERAHDEANVGGEEQTDDEVDEETEFGEPTHSVTRPTIEPTTRGRKTEVLRAGDEIEYTSPIFVCGDSRGYRKTTVMEIRPRENPILKLYNADVLPESTMVRRVRVMIRGKLVDYPNGVSRPIDFYKLRADKIEGADTVVRDRFAREQKAVGQVMDKLAINVAAATKEAGYGELEDGFLAGTKRKHTASSAETRTRMATGGNDSNGQLEAIAIEKDSKIVPEPIWKLKLLKQIETIRENKSKRRSAPPHMPEEQLEFAIRVMERSVELGISISDLAEKVNADVSVLTYFLTGDPNAFVRAKTHDLTQSLLEKWMKKGKSVKSKQHTMSVASARKSATANMEYEKSDSQDDCFPSLQQQETVAIEDSKPVGAPLWKLKLLKQIEAIQNNKSKRRSAPPHMPEEQLQFAIRVMERSIELGMSIPELAEEVDADVSVLTYFLTGDPDARVRAKNHDSTVSLLKKWMGEDVNALGNMTRTKTAIATISTKIHDDLSPSSVSGLLSSTVKDPSKDQEQPDEVEKAKTGEGTPTTMASKKKQKKTAMKTKEVEVRPVRAADNLSSAEIMHLVEDAGKKQKKSGTKPKEIESRPIRSPERQPFQPKMLVLEQGTDKTKGPEPEWKSKLLKLLENIRSEKRKRRSAPPHLSEEDLEVAIKVCESMESFDIDVEALAETLEVSERNLEYFLSGDETKQVFARQHRVTRTLLEKWLQNETNGTDNESSKGKGCGSRKKRQSFAIIEPTEVLNMEHSASLDQSSQAPPSKKPKRDEIADLASEKSHAEDNNSDLMLESDSESEESTPVDVDWDARLAELLELSQNGKTHMTKVQLEIAVRVRRRVAEIHMTISALAEALDLPLIGLTRFLEGDKDEVMGEASHKETEASLEKWLEQEFADCDNQSQTKSA